MNRLINADELVDELTRETPKNIRRDVTIGLTDVLDTIYESETVNAIPISFIDEYKGRAEMLHDDSLWNFCVFIEQEWRRANENN